MGPSRFSDDVDHFLVETSETVNSGRQDDYGSPDANFKRIADIWQVLFPERKWTSEDVSRAMIGLKLARTGVSYKRDTYIDLAGYAALAAALVEKENDV